MRLQNFKGMGYFPYFVRKKTKTQKTTKTRNGKPLFKYH